MFSDIREFHEKFRISEHDKPEFLDTDLANFRVKFMEEELDEFVVAMGKDDIAGMADALIDLVYVAMGTAHMMGLPWQALWREVHNANMRKVRTESAETSKRKSPYDVVKPPGWKPPRIAEILEAASRV